jgi:hypothetical protein
MNVRRTLEQIDVGCCCCDADQRPSAFLALQENFMPRFNTTLALSALALTLYSGIATAQQTPLPAKSAPAATAPATTGTKAESSTSTSTWDKTKAMTRKEWDVAKKKWAMEKVKWQDCNRQSKADKLTAPKSWSFIGSCMTKS